MTDKTAQVSHESSTWPNQITVHLKNPEASPPGVSARLDTWSRIIAAVAIPIILAVYAQKVTQATEVEKTRLQYIQLALGVLGTKEQDSDLRTWAVQVMNRYSDEKLPESLAKKLENGTIILPGTEAVGGITLDNAKQAILNVDSINKEADQWGAQKCPPGTSVQVSKSTTTTSRYPGKPFTSWNCVNDSGQREGPLVNIWLHSKLVATEGYMRAGQSVGWWNFYDPSSKYTHSNCYTDGKLIKHDQLGGPYTVGEACD